MRLFPVETFEKLFGSRYAVVVVTARRAMRIREGSEPLVDVDSKNPLTIALTELAAGLIHPEAPQPPAEGEEAETEEELELAEGDDLAEAEDLLEVEDADEAVEAAGPSLADLIAEAPSTTEADDSAEPVAAEASDEAEEEASDSEQVEEAAQAEEAQE